MASGHLNTEAGDSSSGIYPDLVTSQSQQSTLLCSALHQLYGNFHPAGNTDDGIMTRATMYLFEQKEKTGARLKYAPTQKFAICKTV